MIKNINVTDDFIQKLNSNNRTCVICQENYKIGEKVGLTKCNHLYHHECIKEWLTKQCITPTCPTCRHDCRLE